MCSGYLRSSKIRLYRREKLDGALRDVLTISQNAARARKILTSGTLAREKFFQLRLQNPAPCPL